MDDAVLGPSSNSNNYTKTNKLKNVPDISPKKMNSPEFVLAAGSKQ